MKIKIALLGLMLITASAYSQTFRFMDWVSDGFATVAGPGQILNSSGAQVQTTDNWLVQMYSTVLGNVSTLADGTLLPGVTTSAAFGANGQFGDFSRDYGADATSGLTVFSVIFNASTIGGATEYAIIDGVIGTRTPFMVGTYDNLSANTTEYNTGGTVAGDWVAIPEPSTYAMILCGAGLLAYRRFRRS